MSAATSPGAYPGNPSLPREVREKILSTFRHTLNLFKQGKLDDCLIGCDFILKMDPRFSPARRLLEKTRNPAADVDLVELESLVAATPTRQERVGAAEPERLLVRAVESFNARDFDAAITTAQQVLTVLPGNQNAQEILDKARRKKTAQPEFEAARHRAISALERSRPSEAAPELSRMRLLDPDHPAVALLESRIGSAPDAGAGAASPELGGMMDFSLGASDLDGSLDRPAEEPEIAFGRTDPPKATPAPRPAPPLERVEGLDALSLDSLSLEGDDGSAVSPPPPDPLARHWGPLGDPGPAAPPAAQVSPGSPGDLWREAPAAESEEEATPAGPQPSFSAPSFSGFSEEEDSGAAEREIEILLHQGDDAAQRGDRQGAIEVWSRIFLIDINNVEAVTRIESTRQQMSEGNRRAAECLKAGRERFESGDYDGARESFLEVLTTDATDATARSYLDRIEARLSPVESAGEAGTGAVADPERSTSVQPPARAKSASRRMRRLPLPPRVAAMIGGFLILVGVAAWFLLRQPAPAPPAVAVPGPAARGSLLKAKALLQEGKIPEATSELKRIPPSDPDHAGAQQLLASLDRSAAPGAPPVAIPVPAASVPAVAENDPQRLRAEAETALADKRYIDSLRAFRLASPDFPADPAFSKSMAVATDRVSELTPAVKLYNEGEYETAIPVLWRLVQADKGNQDARSYLLRSYYNQGVTQLLNGLFPKAKQSFDEALQLAPGDEQLQRNRKFAERYLKEDLDLMGRIYVRHLSHRP